jgi:hypothetical protein
VQEFLVQLCPPPIGFVDHATGQQPQPSQFVEIYRGTLTKFEATQLLPGTRYQARLACSNMAGWSEFSNSLTVLTAAAAPALTSMVSLVDATTLVEGALIVNSRRVP